MQQDFQIEQKPSLPENGVYDLSAPLDPIPGIPYSCPLQHVIKWAWPQLSDDMVTLLREFLSSTLQMDPRTRPAPTELLQHCWFGNIEDIIFQGRTSGET